MGRAACPPHQRQARRLSDRPFSQVPCSCPPPPPVPLGTCLACRPASWLVPAASTSCRAAAACGPALRPGGGSAAWGLQAPQQHGMCESNGPTRLGRVGRLRLGRVGRLRPEPGGAGGPHTLGAPLGAQAISTVYICCVLQPRARLPFAWKVPLRPLFRANLGAAPALNEVCLQIFKANAGQRAGHWAEAGRCMWGATPPQLCTPVAIMIVLHGIFKTLGMA